MEKEDSKRDLSEVDDAGLTYIVPTIVCYYGGTLRRPSSLDIFIYLSYGAPDREGLRHFFWSMNSAVPMKILSYTIT